MRSRLYDIIEALIRIGEAGVSAARVALAYPRQACRDLAGHRGAPSEQLDDNLAAADAPLSEAERASWTRSARRR